MRKTLCVFAVILLLTFAFAGTALAQGEPLTQRVAGATRIDTAVAVSRNTFTRADTVVIATATNFPDALTGVPLACAYNAPLLLTDPAVLSPQVRDEVKRLGAGKAVILGGTVAVSSRVETELKNMGLAVTRIAGRNRYETAVRIAERLEAVKGVANRVYIATGTNFADALSVSPVAARAGAPVLLTEPNTLPPEVANFITGYKSRFKGEPPFYVNVIGGEKAVSLAVEERLWSIAGSPTNVERIAGQDRIATAMLVANHGYTEGYLDTLQDGSGTAFLAAAYNFPDALAGGVMAAKTGSPVYLTRPDVLDSRFTAILTGGHYGRAVIFGGTGAVSGTVERNVADLLTHRKTLSAGWMWTGSIVNRIMFPADGEKNAENRYFKNGVLIIVGETAHIIHTTVGVDPKTTLPGGITWDMQMATLREVLTRNFGSGEFTEKLMDIAQQKDCQFKKVLPDWLYLIAPDGRNVCVRDESGGIAILVYPPGVTLNP